jgi:hypothetical protein
MDELRLLTTDATARQAEGPQAGPRDASSRWRLELERAQWAVRSQRASAAAQQLAPQAAVQQRTEGTRPPSLASEARALPPSRTSAPAAKGEAGGAMRQSSQPPRAAGEAAKPASGFGLAQRTAEAGGASPLPAARPAAPRPVPVVWPRVNVHAMAGGAATDVWVRDAGLTGPQRAALAAELRTRMHATGRRLGMLTVNGEQIFPPERTSPWQSKR